MANVLPYKPLEVYDLKGTTEDRWVNPETKGVLKDNNFQGHRMFFTEEQADILRQQIRDDAEFLLTLGVMDYSLLVGVTDPSKYSGSERRGHLGAHAASGWLERPQKPHEAMVFQMGIIDYL